MNPTDRPRLADLDAFDMAFQPRISMQAVFTTLAVLLSRPGESFEQLLTYLVTRTHCLGAYRGGSSGFDEESRAVASIHFRQLGIPCLPEQVFVSCGGAKGWFLALCAALMCRRRFDELHHVGGVVLAPEGYYQSLRLIPAIFGGSIDVVPLLTGASVSQWLTSTARRPNRVIYAPLVNNATGEVLTAERAHDIGGEILKHNAHNHGNPVFVIGDDVYAGSYLDPDLIALPIGAVTGMSDWTLSVVSPSKTFALPTCRVAFATTTHARLATAVRHYRTVFAHGRVPQTNELTGTAALALTPAGWIDGWNRQYRDRLALITTRLEMINSEIGAKIIRLRPPEGGWYLRLGLARELFPVTITSSIDAFAVLLHYGGDRVDSGLGLLPGELFGHRLRSTDAEVILRATIAVDNKSLSDFTTRLRDAVRVLRGPRGAEITQQALRRARRVADIDAILANTRY